MCYMLLIVYIIYFKYVLMWHVSFLMIEWYYPVPSTRVVETGLPGCDGNIDKIISINFILKSNRFISSSYTTVRKNIFLNTNL